MTESSLHALVPGISTILAKEIIVAEFRERAKQLTLGNGWLV
jgi:hypothetical protein